MKDIYQKIIYSVMIAAFVWVIVGDLVNMHIKLIYKKDIATHNIFFVKTVKKDKSDYKFSIKKIHTQDILFFDYQDNIFNLILPYINISNFSKEYNLSFSFCLFKQLRAPPAI